MPDKVLNALTFDVEDYYMVSAFEPQVPKSDWLKLESRIERNTHKILGILQEYKIKGTFFALGWIGQQFPKLMKDIRQEGHEIACHGYSHQLLYNMTPESFREDIRKSRKILEDASGSPVVGYRAPSFSIVQETLWALPILREEGFQFDSSILPAPHARGGLQGANRHPHRLEGLMELPMSILQVAGKKIPFSGGGYFRMFPYSIIRRGALRCNAEGLPVVTYFHPWEFDPDQPRIKGGSAFDRFKHYLNLDKTEEKFRRFIQEFRFGTVSDVLATIKI